MKLLWRQTARDVVLKPGSAALDGNDLAVVPLRDGGELVGLEVDGVRVPLRVSRQGGRVLVWCAGRVHEFFTEQTGRRTAASEHAGDLLAPMPGRVRRTPVAAGQAVARGDVVMILEAMKMEHAIRAPYDGVVARVCHAEGDLVDAGVALAEMTPKAPS